MEGFQNDKLLPNKGRRRKRQSLEPGNTWVEWCLVPWITGVCLAPLLFGSVNSDHLAVVGLLLGISFLLLSGKISYGIHWNRRSKILLLILLWVVVLPLIPLPHGLLEIISPERAKTAKIFSTTLDNNYTRLTLSTSETIQRLWQLLLIAVSFLLARFSASGSRFPRGLLVGLASTIVILAVSEVWRKFNGGGNLLGVWEVSNREGTGTFANRNHFANWMIVASLFISGFCVRDWIGKSAAPQFRFFSPFLRIGMGIIVLTGLMMAALTGSRGGTLSILAALMFAGVMAMRLGDGRDKRKLVFAGCVILFGLLLSSGLFLDRLGSLTEDGNFKVKIWAVALKIFMLYPIFGSGLGTFERASTYYKASDGTKTYLHTENDYLQLLSETGIITFLLCIIGLAWTFRRLNQSPEARHPAFIGAMAGMVAFLVHACFEFVSQIPSTAILGATVMGALHGMANRKTTPIVAPASSQLVIGNAIGAIIVILLAGLQISAAGSFRSGLGSASKRTALSGMQKSLQIWPWETSRAVSLASITGGISNLEPEQTEGVSKVLNSSLLNDEWNWRLRLEMLILAIREGETLESTAEEARKILLLNPLQPALPVVISEIFLKFKAPATMEFLKAAANFPENGKKVLSLAWSYKQDTALLWSLAPNTAEGMQNLGDFAAAKELNKMAELAYDRIGEKLRPEIRANNYRKAQAYVKALELVSGTTPVEKYLRARILFESGRFVEAIHEAEELWENRTGIPTFFDQTNSIAKEMLEGSAQSRDLSRLRRLAAQEPFKKSALWVLVETQRELGDYRAAAADSIRLASLIVEQSLGQSEFEELKPVFLRW